MYCLLKLVNQNVYIFSIFMLHSGLVNVVRSSCVVSDSDSDLFYLTHKVEVFRLAAGCP